MSERSGNNPDKHPPVKKPSKRLKLIKRAITLALLAVALAAGVVLYLVKSEPAYWKQHEKFLAETSPRQMEELAGQVQDKLRQLANLGLDENDPATRTLRELTGQGAQAADGDGETTAYKIKPEDIHINTEQTITLDNKQIAGFIQTRLDDWMQERGYVKPPEIAKPMIAVTGGELVMAFQLAAGGYDQIISGKFNLKTLDNGMAELSLKRFFVGNLPVPADSLGAFLKEHTGDSRAAKAGRWLEKLQYLEFKPVIELEHRRRARVTDHKVLDNALELTVRIQDHKTYKEMNEALAGVPVD